MRLCRMVGSAVALLLCTLATACADGTPSVGATPSAPQSAAPTTPPRTAPTTAKAGPLSDPDSPRRIVYDRGLVSDPLPASAARVKMTADQAIDIAAEQTTISSEQQPGRPEATLRLVYPGEASVAGRAAWVLTWRNSAAAVRGPVSMTESERRRLAAELECVFVVTVDPTSATSTNALQLCEPK